MSHFLYRPTADFQMVNFPNPDLPFLSFLPPGMTPFFFIRLYALIHDFLFQIFPFSFLFFSDGFLLLSPPICSPESSPSSTSVGSVVLPSPVFPQASVFFFFLTLFYCPFSLLFLRPGGTRHLPLPFSSPLIPFSVPECVFGDFIEISPSHRGSVHQPLV